MPSQISKRFYKSVDVEPSEDGYGIFLDGRSVRTPVGAALAVPFESLAKAMAEEWDAQTETISPLTMPLTGLANTAIDRIVHSRNAVLDEMVQYAETDLLCYRAEDPADLVANQVKTWQPLLDWAVETFAARMTVTEGIMPISQPDDALAKLRAIIEIEENFQLTALSALTAACGSLIIALAVRRGRLDADQAFEISQLDESHQIELWGEDDEARDKRQHLRENISNMTQFLVLSES